MLDFLATAGSTSDTTSAGAQPTTTAFPFKLGHGVTVLEVYAACNVCAGQAVLIVVRFVNHSWGVGMGCRECTA